jgi:hypothetical protein
MKFATLVGTDAETSEAEPAVAKPIVNSVRKDATRDAIIAAKQDAASIVVITSAEIIAVIS